MSKPVLEARRLARVYRDGELEVTVFREVNFCLMPASRVAIVGASGSGKSTLLNLLGGLDKPSSGSVLLQGRDINRLSESERCRLRNRELGFVYQFHHLLPEFSAVENVAMPLLISGASQKQSRSAAAALLSEVGLEQRLQHRPAQLSGGERQRVAIARALVMQPGCVLMDEPTGNLDSAAAEHVMQLIDELASSSGSSFVVVTHDKSIAAQMDQRFELANATLARR